MKTNAINIRFFYLLLFLASLTGIFFIIHHYHLPIIYVLTDTFVSTALLVSCVWTGSLMVNNYPTKAGLIIYAMIVGVIAGVIVFFLDKLFLHWWFEGEEIYLNWFQYSLLPRLVIFMLITSSIIITASLNRKAIVLEEGFNLLTDAATLHREAELFKLRQQLQPHFLYNSLNSISALILIEPDKAQEMIGKLSDFLRHSVKREGKEQIPIEEELEYIEAYLSIEAVRFGDRLNIIYNKQFAGAYYIPPFLLQPLLENAIKFGLYGKTGHVTINMNIETESNYLKIMISNPYEPDQRPPTGTGFGIEGIQRRLFLLFGRNDLLKTRQENETFTTELKIPQRYV